MSWVEFKMIVTYYAGPDKLTIKLSGAPLQKHGGAAGTYMLGPNTINGKRHYLQIDGPHALWYGSGMKNWGVGLKKNLGKSFTVFITGRNTANSLPDEVSGWQWEETRGWNVSPDIVVEKEG